MSRPKKSELDITSFLERTPLFWIDGARSTSICCLFLLAKLGASKRVGFKQISALNTFISLINPYISNLFSQHLNHMALTKRGIHKLKLEQKEWLSDCFVHHALCEVAFLLLQQSTTCKSIRLYLSHYTSTQCGLCDIYSLYLHLAFMLRLSLKVVNIS